MASYGKKMLEASLKLRTKQSSKKTPALGAITEQKRQPLVQSSSSQGRDIPGKRTHLTNPSEKCKPDKVSNWLESCPDTISEIQSDIIIPSSIPSEVNETTFPALLSDVGESDIGSMEEENDEDYQPSLSSDDEDSIEVANQGFDETSTTHESQLVTHAISRNGAVILNKKQFCYFCEKPQLKLARHLTSQHKTESAVAQLLAAKSVNPKKYQIGLKRLKCLGNFVHNIKSLKEKKSDIVVVK